MSTLEGLKKDKLQDFRDIWKPEIWNKKKIQILKSKQPLRATWKLSADYTTIDPLNYWHGNPCAVESMYFGIDAAKFWSNFIAWTFVQWFYFIDMGIQMQRPDLFDWSTKILIQPSASVSPSAFNKGLNYQNYQRMHYK